jgi:hypothetical protein
MTSFLEITVRSTFWTRRTSGAWLLLKSVRSRSAEFSRCTPSTAHSHAGTKSPSSNSVDRLSWCSVKRVLGGHRMTSCKTRSGESRRWCDWEMSSLHRHKGIISPANVPNVRGSLDAKSLMARTPRRARPRTVTTLQIRHLKQSRAMCGPACLKIVMAYFGTNVSERAIAKGVAIRCRQRHHRTQSGPRRSPVRICR